MKKIRLNFNFTLFSVLLGYFILVSFQTAYAQVKCNGETPTIFGTEGDDVLTGTSGDDVIVGLGGNDTIDGLAGKDKICAGDGNDIVSGGDGEDSIDGGSGDDTIEGNEGVDQLIGGLGKDTISGGDDNDTIQGDDGDDNLSGDSGDDQIFGGNKNDTISGGFGNDTIQGDEGDDIIEGNEGDDTISGNLGNDTIDGGEGDDTIQGGEEDDNISGNEGDDTISGNLGNDIIDGGDGDDTLNGGANIDTLDGGLGENTCIDGEFNTNCTTETGGETDLTPPTTSIDSPIDPIINESTPQIIVTYLDASGVDLNFLKILVDTNDITPICTVDTSSATCASPALADGQHTIDAEIRDIPGNPATDSFTFEVELIPPDTDPPSITATIEPPPNTAGWNNESIIIKFNCVDTLSGVASCTDLVVNTEGANQVVTGTGTDNNANTATLDVTVNVDLTDPSIIILSPENSSITKLSTVNITGTANDALSGLDSVTCNDTPATLTGSDFNCDVSLEIGENTIEVKAFDIAGNEGTQEIIINFVPGPEVQITSPNNLDIFSSSPITVFGTIDDPNATVAVNGVSASVSGGTFTASNVPIKEGSHVVTAVATDQSGNVGTSSITVVLDTTAPIVKINSPADNATITQSTVTVTGLVNDIVTRAATGTELFVTINGVNATALNGTFMAEIPIAQGINTITATAEDFLGNTSSDSIVVNAQIPAGQRIELVSGDNQTGQINTTLLNPLVVQLSDASGNPVSGRNVNFRVLRGDGIINTTTETGRNINITSDTQGQAQVDFTLGTRSGLGANIVEATATGFAGEITFHATSNPGFLTGIQASTGLNQLGAIGEPLSEPFVTFVHDSGGNPLEGITVTFEVIEGRGNFNGNTTITDITDEEGRATATLTLGNIAGVSNNIATVSIPSGFTATFVATAVIPGLLEDTKVSGVVLDHVDTPIEGITVLVDGTTLQTLTNDQGFFKIQQSPVGPITLIVNGSTSNRQGTWPELDFEMDLIQGVTNTLGSTIYLLPIDEASGQIVGGNQDVVITIPELPGFSMTVFANSVTFPDGSTEGLVSVTQVHSDKVPMIPTKGANPSYDLTIQPPGAIFNPPAKVQFPNVDNLKPGKVTDIVSFDHDIFEFVTVGTAIVSEDGALIISDPGFGIFKSGWHYTPPDPPEDGCAADCPECKFCEAIGGNICLPNLLLIGDSCDGDLCKECTFFGNCEPKECENECLTCNQENGECDDPEPMEDIPCLNTLDCGVCKGGSCESRCNECQKCENPFCIEDEDKNTEPCNKECTQGREARCKGGECECQTCGPLGPPVLPVKDGSLECELTYSSPEGCGLPGTGPRSLYCSAFLVCCFLGCDSVCLAGDEGIGHCQDSRCKFAHMACNTSDACPFTGFGF